MDANDFQPDKRTQIVHFCQPECQPVDTRNFVPVVNVFSPVGVPLLLGRPKPDKPPDIDNDAGLILPPAARVRLPPLVPREDLVGGRVIESPIPKDDCVSPKMSLPLIVKASGT